ncbi:MAG: permease [Candidatus Zixiibacteriota bacterium]|nr:MAG: permease [candidate division Zixibacteria bacterium]
MLIEIKTVLSQMWAGLIHLWPYLLITVPLAAIINVAGFSKYISRALGAKPLTAISLAAAVGAFSPFCSCGVIPVIASLLLGGVPLAPVMTFWIASPSMDPEIFFLSVGMLGWKMAVWRLVATLLMSLGAGYITHFLVARGWINEFDVMTSRRSSGSTGRQFAVGIWQDVKGFVVSRARAIDRSGTGSTTVALSPAHTAATCYVEPEPPTCGCNSVPAGLKPASGPTDVRELSFDGQGEVGVVPNIRLFLKSALDATYMVAKFMALALLLESLIKLYIPSVWITSLLGQQNNWAVPVAALIGIPVYTGNLTALPMIAGLMQQGMAPAAALAFLVAGPTTTLPAMAAVWGLVSRRVFGLYLLFVLSAAIIFWYAFWAFRG